MHRQRSSSLTIILMVALLLLGVGCGVMQFAPTPPDNMYTSTAQGKSNIVATLTADALKVILSPTLLPPSRISQTPRVTLTPMPPTLSPGAMLKGTLINKATGKPLIGARVILCPKRSKESLCVIAARLTSVTDSDGRFNITGAETGEYVVLYNTSGRIRPEWDAVKLEYSPVSTFSDPAPTNINHLMKSLKVSSLSTCEAFYEIVEGNLVVSGYLYADSVDLAFIFLKGELIYVKAQNGEGNIDLRVWDPPRKDGCEEGDSKFNPIASPSVSLLPKTTSTSTPALAFPKYSEVIKTYPKDFVSCKTVATLDAVMPNGTWLLNGTTEFRNNKMMVKCYGTKITIGIHIEIDGKTYEPGTKLTVDKDINWVQVSSWD